MKKFVAFIATIILTVVATVGTLYATKSFDVVENKIGKVIKVATNDYVHDTFVTTNGDYEVTVDEQPDGTYVITAKLTAKGGIYKLEGAEGTPTVKDITISYVIDSYNDDIKTSLEHDYARVTEM